MGFDPAYSDCIFIPLKDLIHGEGGNEMDWYIIIAGLIAAATTVGHFAVGSKQFLKPMLGASFDPVPKK